MKRGPYDCDHVTEDRVAYDKAYYAANRVKILRRRRERRKFKLKMEVKHGRITVDQAANR